MTNKKDDNIEITKEKEETKKIDESIKDEKSKGLLIKIIIAVFIVLFIIICGKFVYDKLKDDNSIAGVRKLLDTKYADITCIDYECNGFIAIEGDKLTKYKVILYNSDGKKVANYKVKYNSENKTTELPIDIADDFYISSTTNLEKLKVVNYSIKNSKGKTIFETSNTLSILNDNLVSMKENDQYTLLSKKGKTIYSNISSINSYINAKYIVIKVDNSYFILNSKGEKLLDGYKISKVVKDENDKEVYAIVRNEKDSVYNYYDLDKNKIVGDSFSSYTQNDNLVEFTITKKENDKNVKYLLKENGKQEKLDEELTKFEDEIKEKIDSNLYKLYDVSIYNKNQKYVFVDNMNDKTFGILNIKDNNYIQIYNYKSDKNYMYSTISELKSNVNEGYFKISCSSSYCDTTKSLVYDLDETKEVYDSSEVGTILNYTEYKGGYKVVKLSSNDNKYNSKYVIYDKDNKELLISKDNVVIIDKKLIIGSQSSYSLALYSTKKEKILNDTLVSAVEVNENKLYKYEVSNNAIVLNSDGEEIIKVNKDDYLKLSSNSYVYIKDNTVNIYNIGKDKTYTYKLKDNEKLNNAAGTIISPYKNAIFINNTTDNYVKVLDFKANQIKKINKVQISSVNINSSKKKAFIIVKKVSDKADVYGLYVAE